MKISADKDLPSIIEAVDENGGVIKLKVIYENLPPKCDNCLCFGHLLNQCPMSKIPVPKYKVSETTKGHNDIDNSKGHDKY